MESLLASPTAVDSFPRVVLEDFLLRRLVEVAPLQYDTARLTPGQFILSRSCLRLVDGKRVLVSLERRDGNLGEEATRHLVRRWRELCVERESLLAEAAASVSDAATVRRWVEENGGVAFIANGSVLARDGGASDPDSPLGASCRSVPFVAPASLQREVLLGGGRSVEGLLIPRGVTVITGGGFHGKSTLLRALAMGSLDKIPGDGRELCVTTGRSMTIRSEDGRCVGAVDISPFISGLPPSCGIDVSNFSTASASGSTSSASGVMEALEMGCSLFLLDEDTSAGNFMIRDSRMRSLIDNEPITPYIYRVNSLHRQLGVSTIVVVGGSGDWFDVQDTTLQLDDYACRDVTRRVLQISKTFCTGRVEYNGRGLVHQLPWTHEAPTPAAQRRFDIAQLAVSGLGSDAAAVRASEDGQVLLYGPRLSLDLSKIEQRVPTREAQAAALGVGAAFLWLSRSSALTARGTVSVREAMDAYAAAQGVGGEGWDDIVAELGPRPFVLPLPTILAASLNRLRGLAFYKNNA